MFADGTKTRLLTVIVNFSRERLALEAANGIKSPQVVDILRRLVSERGAPRRIRCDNGPEYISLYLDKWAHWAKVKVTFLRAG